MQLLSISNANVTLENLTISEKTPTPPGDVEAYFNAPKTCALYLTDALETCQADEITAALRDIRRANCSKVQSLNDESYMYLAEVMEILGNAGIRLVAVPIPTDQT